MADLAALLVQKEPLEWVIGTVTVITGDTFTMLWRGGTVYNVGHVSGYTPVVNDIVHCLSWGQNGMLAFGKTASTILLPALPTPTVTTVNSNGTATWGPGDTAWEASVLKQEPNKLGCFFYTQSDFDPIKNAELSKVEIQVTRTSGGPPEFRLHGNLSGTGPLILGSATIFTAPTPAAGVPTWIPLPIGWGQRLILSTDLDAFGIGIGLGEYSGVYTSTGNLRITTI